VTGVQTCALPIWIPPVESAFDRHSGSEFCGNQRDWDAPEKREHQQVNQSEPGPRGGDHIFQAEGAACGVGKHYEDEIEEAGFS
jgi:hypothetical protein